MVIPTRANITHSIDQHSLSMASTLLKDRIIQRGDLPDISVQDQLAILEEMLLFPLGQFLVENRGLNGYWTDYILKYPLNKTDSDSNSLSSLEKFLLNEAPTLLATQERFLIFKDLLQQECKEGIVVASVPCGLMSDLLDLDYSGLQKFKLIGSDIDERSIQQALNRSERLGLDDHTSFILNDAWQLKLPEPVDVLTSNGLNIYEKDDNRVVELYHHFFRALKPGGKLITSFLTPPPSPGEMASEWNLSCINMNHAKKQKIILSDILGVKWQVFRSGHKTLSQLHEAGFHNIKFIYDRAHIFPTVIAEKG